jgi:hypothetical protein
MELLFKIIAISATAQIAEVTGLAAAFQNYGPWAFVALLVLAVGWLARKYIESRDSKDQAIADLNKYSLDLIERQISASNTKAQALDKLSAALTAHDDKLCDLEKTIEDSFEKFDGRLDDFEKAITR